MTSKSAKIWQGICTLSVAGFATIAVAAPVNDGPRVAAFQQLTDCRKLIESLERLACYDKAAAGLDAAEAAGDVVVVDRAQVTRVRRQAFGLSMPSLSFFDRGATPEDSESIVLKIESAAQDGSGKWTLRLEGGQVWRQIDTEVLSRDPKPGGMATIRRAALGSYKLSLGGASTIRVHRDN